MQTFGFKIKIRNSEARERYVNYHRSVWPEVHDALDVIGVHSVQIFLLEDDTLFMHMETSDEFSPFRSFSNAMTQHPLVQQWDDIMHKELLVRDPHNSGPTEWADMEKLYHWEDRPVEIQGADR